jgi:enoyl-CoA hydratase
MNEKILFEKRENGVAILTFNRPYAHNALDLEAMTRFKAVIESLASDLAVRVLILTGAGHRAFCSGGDLNDLADHQSEDDALDFITIMGDALLKMERLPFPVIGAINGYALGGGSEIAVACDMRIVDDHTRMGFIQIRMGVTPGWGAGQRLLRLVGYPQALDLLLHGHVMHAHELQTLGLANRVVEQGMALEHALYFANHIVEHSRELVGSIKTLLQAGLNHTYEQALQIERDLFPALWAGDEHKQAVDNFLEKQAQRKGAKT